MSSKPVTAKEMESSLAELFSKAVEHAYKDLIEQAVKEEREACAKVSEDWDSDMADPRDIAAAIRARGEKT